MPGDVDQPIVDPAGRAAAGVGEAGAVEQHEHPERGDERRDLPVRDEPAVHDADGDGDGRRPHDPGARPGPPSATSTTVKPITAETERSMHRTSITRTWPITTTPSTAAWRVVLRSAASLKKRGDVTRSDDQEHGQQHEAAVVGDEHPHALGHARGRTMTARTWSTVGLSVTLGNLDGMRLPRTSVVCTSC